MIYRFDMFSRYLSHHDLGTARLTACRGSQLPAYPCCRGIFVLGQSARHQDRRDPAACPTGSANTAGAGGGRGSDPAPALGRPWHPSTSGALGAGVVGHGIQRSVGPPPRPDPSRETPRRTGRPTLSVVPLERAGAAALCLLRRARSVQRSAADRTGITGVGGGVWLPRCLRRGGVPRLQVEPPVAHLCCGRWSPAATPPGSGGPVGVGRKTPCPVSHN